MHLASELRCVIYARLSREPHFKGTRVCALNNGEVLDGRRMYAVLAETLSCAQREKQDREPDLKAIV